MPRSAERLAVGGVEPLGGDPLGQLGHVLALVAVLGRLLAGHPGGDRVGEAADLAAGVVDVELALDLVADRLQQPHEGVAVGGVATAADVQRAGRVGGDELDQDPLGRRGRRRAEVLAGRDQRGQRAPVPGVGEEEVDEAGAGDLDPVEAAGAAEVALELAPQALGDGARVVAQRRRPAASPRWSCSRPARASAGGRARAPARSRSPSRRARAAWSTAPRSSAIESVALTAPIVWTAAAPRVRWPLARSRPQRHPLQPARPRSRPRGDRRRPASRRSGASATWSATAPSPTPARRWSASAATSAWSATTTSRCSARSTSPPSRRPPRRRSSGPGRRRRPETLEFLARPRAGGRARGRRPLPRLPARPDLGVRALDRPGRSRPRRPGGADRPDRPLPRRALLHPARTAARRGYAHGAQAGDGALLDLDDGAWLLNPGSVGQPRDGDPRAAWLELDTERVDGALPPRPLRHRRGRRGDPRGRPARAPGGAPRRSAADAQMQGKYRSPSRSLDSNHGPPERIPARPRPRRRRGAGAGRLRRRRRRRPAAGHTASEITSNLDEVEQLVDEGDCVGAEDAARQVSDQVDALGGVDKKLKQALREGADAAQRSRRRAAKKRRRRTTEAIEPKTEEPKKKPKKEEKPEKPEKPKQEKPKKETDRPKPPPTPNRRRPEARRRRRRSAAGRRRRRHALGRRRPRRRRRKANDGGGNPLRAATRPASGSAPAGCRTSTRRPTGSSSAPSR